MHYHIQKAGETRQPVKPYLIITMCGYDWGSRDYAHKFLDLDGLKYILEDLKAKGEKVFATWHDESKNPPHGSWGEVNPHALATL